MTSLKEPHGVLEVQYSAGLEEGPVAGDSLHLNSASGTELCVGG